MSKLREQIERSVGNWIACGINLNHLDQQLKRKAIKEDGKTIPPVALGLLMISFFTISALTIWSLRDNSVNSNITPTSPFALPFVLEQLETQVPTEDPFSTTTSTPIPTGKCVNVKGDSFANSNFVQAVQSLGTDSTISGDTQYVVLKSFSQKHPSIIVSTAGFDENPQLQESYYDSIYAIGTVCELAPAPVDN